MSFIHSKIKNTREIVLENKAANVATTSGLLYDLVGGLLVAATSSSTVATLAGVANQTISASVDTATQCPVLKLDENDTWIADSTNNSDVTHNGQDMIVGANAGVINNTGTTSAVGVVKQVGVYGAAADKKIIVSFLK